MLQLSIRFVVAALVVFSASVHSAELKAPVGLQWGQTQQQIRSQGVILSDCNVTKMVVWKCRAIKPPKPIASALHYLYFYPGLQRAEVWLGATTSDDDPHGVESKHTFADLKKRLINKYGEPNSLLGETQAFWKFGDASITITLKRTPRWSWVQLDYVSKDEKKEKKRLLDEARSQRAPKDDAGL